MIRHANLCPALPIGSLAIAMIQPSFGTLLMAEVGGTPLFTARLAAAAVTAVLLTPIT
jgi:hypothetical protein